MSTNVAVRCGHCGRPIDTTARGNANGTWLCHTGTLPPNAEPRDCYRLVTVYGHSPEGSCCRSLTVDVRELESVMATVRFADLAMRVEGIDRDTADRVLCRLLYGQSDPDRVRAGERFPHDLAVKLLHIWLDVCLGGAAAPDARCPKCRSELTAYTVGRDWFTAQPCGCLFNIDAPAGRADG
jgi:hypothetical protein